MLMLETKLDASELEKRLEDHKVNNGRIAKKMMTRVFAEMRKQIQSRMLSGAVLKRRTGGLKFSINYWAFPDMTGSIFSRSLTATYHEDGPTHILPKNHKYLTFKVNGEWKKMERVTLPKREFIRPVFELWMQSGMADRLMERTLQEELDKIYGGA
jgi:hypothetical protein